MSKKTYSQILDGAASNRLTKNFDLAPQIMLRIQKGKGARMQTRIKVVAMTMLFLLVLVIVLANVPVVLAAIQRWFGYVPEIGLVREGEMRALAEPVALTRDGITLTVEQVFVDSEKTTVIYSVDGLTADMLKSDPAKYPPDLLPCEVKADLRWSGKEPLPSQDFEITMSWSTGYKVKSSFMSIPSGVNEITFEAACIRSTLPGKAPVNWSLPFRLVAAAPNLTAFPVIEIATPTLPAATVMPQDTSSLDPANISLRLDRAVQMNDGYLLYASLHWKTTTIDWVDNLDSATIHLLDAQGREIAFETLDAEQPPLDASSKRHQSNFIFKTAPIPDPGQLTLIFNSLDVTVPAEASFSFDPGLNPQPDQKWILDQNVNLGQGRSLKVMQATYSFRSPGFSFDMQSDSGVTGADLKDLAHPLESGGGGAGVTLFTSGFSYRGDLPSGPITVNIVSFTATLSGHWQVQWQVPASPEGQIAPTPQQSACLTRASWQQAIKNASTLASTGLAGKLAISDVPAPDYQYEVSVVNLDGNSRKLIGRGDSPSLSPDGTRIVYNGPMNNAPPDGLYITELASGNTMRLPGTARGDLGPIWSPDGTQIAFTRGPSTGPLNAPGPRNIVITGIDGSNSRQLTSSEIDSNYAMAWMPDGKHILYMRRERNGASVHTIDIQTGEVDSFFEKNYTGSLAVSPDGKRLAFEEMLPLDKYGLFVSDLDGSNRKLLADGDPYIVTVPTWSPDSQWLIASVQDPDATKQPNPILALIKIESCEIIPLPNLSGYVSDWLP